MAISADTKRLALTDAQLDAIESINVSMAVDAAAGSGKTAVLIRRILRIVGCDHESGAGGDWARLGNVLAITFTDKAAGEIRAKLRAFVPAQERFRLDQAWIGTFHSFCARLIRRHGPVIDIDPSFDLLDENASLLLMQRSAKETLLNALERKDYAAGLLVEEAGFRNALAAIEELMQFRWHANPALANRDGCEDWESGALRALERVFTVVLAAYRANLAKLGALDFQELEIKALDLLSEKQIAAACQTQFQHILVDEYQDTNDIQTEIVLKLFHPGRNRLFIVGDEAQSIYRFRGANVSCFARVRKKIESQNGRLVRLACNFRSREPIIKFVNASQQTLADGLFSEPTLPKPMEAHKKNAGKEPSVVHLSFPRADNNGVDALRGREADAIAKMIRARWDEGAWSPGDVVLLFRAMTSAGIYEDALRRHLVPCSSVGGRGFFERREVADLMAALRFTLDPKDGVALLTLLRSPAIGLSDDEITIMAGPDGRSLLKTVLSSEGPPLAAEFPMLAQHMRPSEIMRRVINEAGLERIWGNLDRSGAAIANMDRLVSIARAIEREMPTTLADFNSFIAEMRTRGAKIGDSPAGANAAEAVRLMSVHAAKGLEFPVVFIPDLMRTPTRNRDQWIFSRGDAESRDTGVAFKKRNPEQPFGKRIKTERFEKLATDEATRDRMESKRLLYVAMTRAMDSLVLPVHEDIKDEGTWHEWAKAALAESKGIAVGISSQDIKIRTSARVKDPRQEKPSRPAPVKNRIMRLSVTQLDSYSVCPVQYYLKYVLGLPAVEAMEADPKRIDPNVYGSIVHGMLARATAEHTALKLAARSEAHANGVAVGDRLISTLEKDASKAIQLAGGDPSQGTRELSFELACDNANISGTIDWLRPEGAGLTVVDFKTGSSDKTKAGLRAEQYEVQMQTYALAAESMTGRKVIATMLVFPSADLVVKKEMDNVRRHKAKEEIGRIVAGIAARDFAVPKSPPCGNCIFHRNRMCWEKP